VRLSFGNFQNGFIAFVQQILGHLGYPYAIRRRQPSMNLGDAIGSNVFRRVAEKSGWPIFSLVRSDRTNSFGRKRNYIAI
jgi:hypothetical protein